MSQAPTAEYALQQLQWRYATKQFDPSKRIADDLWHALEQSLVLTPSSFGLQPWKFFVVENAAIRQQLLPHTWKQTQVVDGSHLVVFAIKKDFDAAQVDRYINRMAEVQGTTPETLAGFAGMVKGFLANPALNIDAWATHQVYIALGEFMTTAAILGIDTCPLEGFVPPQYDEILGLTAQGYTAVVLCVAGYRLPEDKYAAKPKVRYVTEEMVQYIR
jgi:nitroreductase